jgi:hypothetical protein
VVITWLLIVPFQPQAVDIFPYTVAGCPVFLFPAVILPVICFSPSTLKLPKRESFSYYEAATWGVHIMLQSVKKSRQDSVIFILA